MITLYLEGRVRDGGRAALEEFVAAARPFYEAPGGIRVRLQWDDQDPAVFREIMEYADERTYLADQERVEHDPTMRAWLERWHGLLDGRIGVRAFTEVSLD